MCSPQAENPKWCTPYLWNLWISKDCVQSPASSIFMETLRNISYVLMIQRFQSTLGVMGPTAS